MQIEIVGHDRRAEYSNSDVEHRGIPDDIGRRNESAHHLGEWRLRQDDLEQEADTDGRYQSDDERLEQPEPLVLEIENYQYIRRRDDDAVHDRNAAEQVERDGGADYFGEVTRRNCYLAADPEQEVDGPRVVIAARLGE